VTASVVTLPPEPVAPVDKLHIRESDKNDDDEGITLKLR